MDPLFEKKLITTKDAKELSGYTPDYLARLARSGKISGKRIGHGWFIDKESLTNFLNQQDDKKVDYARTLARSREAEYRAHNSLISRATKSLTKPLPIPQISELTKISMHSHFVAFSVASLVIVSGVLVERAVAFPQIATHALAIAHEAAFGFEETFGGVSSRIAKNIDTAKKLTHKDISRDAEIFSADTFAMLPALKNPENAFFAGLHFPSLVASETDKNTFSFSQTIALAPTVSEQSASVTLSATSDVHSFVLDAYVFLVTPSIPNSPTKISRITTTIKNAYYAVGEKYYRDIHASLRAYRSLVAWSGASTLSLAAHSRDTLAHSPQFVAKINLALGTGIVGTAHAILRAETSAVYGIARVAPAIARATAELVGGLGGTLASATERAPSLVTVAFLRTTEAPSVLAPKLSQAIFDAEYAAAGHFVAATNAVSENYLASIKTAGNLAYESVAGSSVITRATKSSVATVPSVLKDTYLGVLGKSALALDSFAQQPKVAIALSVAQTVSNPALAAVLPVLSVSEQVALATYQTIKNFFISTNRTFATLFTPPPPVVLPALKGLNLPKRIVTIATTTSSHLLKNTASAQTTNSYTTIVQGVSTEFVNQSIASLRSGLLSTVSGMIQPIANQSVVNNTTIQQMNMIQDISNLIVRNGDFRGGSLTGGGTVSATNGNFTNLSAGSLTMSSSISATYFTATSNTATSTFAGSLNVDNAGFVYATSTRNVGIGILSPAALLAIQNSTSAQPIFIAKNAAGTEVYRITNAGFVGIGTSSPAYALAVEGSSSLGNQAIAGYFTATSSTATSTFAGSLAVGTSSPVSSGLFVVGTTTPLLYIASTNGRIGIGTSTPASIFDIYGTDALRIPVGTSAQRPSLAGVGQIRYNITTHQFEGYGDNSVWQGLGGVVNAAQTTYITAGADDYLRFVTNSVERMTVNNFGNVGIGTTTPFAAFQIATTTGKNFVLSDSGAGANLKHWLLSSLGGSFYISAATDAYSTSTSALSINNAGVLTLSSALGATSGGTGVSSYTTGDILYADSTNHLTVLTAGSAGNVLKISGGVPTWGLDATGGGTGGGSWSTTTSQVSGEVVNYSNNSSDIIAIGNNSTTTAKYWFDPNVQIAYLSGSVGIGTTTPGSPLSIANIANFTTATSSFYGTGINLASGCFAVNGTCVGSSGIGSGTQGQLAFYNAAGNFLTATSSLFLSQAGNFGIGTTTPAQSLSTSGLLYIGGTGTSTIQNNLQVLGTLKVGSSSIYLTNNGINSTDGTISIIGGAATSTFTALQATSLNITSTTATSTFAAGINLTGGCFAIGGACVLSTSGTLNAGDLASQNNITLQAFRTASSTEQATTTIIADGIADSFSNLSGVDQVNSININSAGGLINSGGGSVSSSTGGTITKSGTDWIHTFTSSGTFTPNEAIVSEYLVVGGGGGSGFQTSGGGGGGGFRTGTGFAVTAQAYTITVGDGGAASASSYGGRGATSTFSTINASGGGGGAMNDFIGLSGGSGGGGGYNKSGGAGNTPATSPSQGNNGGSGGGGGPSGASAGGGGGAGAVGGNGTGSEPGPYVAGNGGAGTASSISGSSVTYAGGGGGGVSMVGGYSCFPGTGGAGGGGSGGGGGGCTGPTTATAGAANTGGGGGGGSNSNGAGGGSGIVIIRYTPSSSGGGTNFTLLSRAFTATTTPSTARLAIQAAATSTIGLNTDLRAAVSRDGGTTWATTTLSQMGSTLEDGTAIYQDNNIDISSQPSGTSMKYRIITASGTGISIHGVVFQWGAPTALAASNLTVNNQLVVSGTGTGLSVSNNTAIGGTLSVTGTSTLAGFLGVGTTTPQWNLQIAGTRPSFALTDTSAGANLKHWLFSSMGGNLYIGTATDAYATSTISALTITNGGNVGIGTSSPSYKLDVAGFINTDQYGGYKQNGNTVLYASTTNYSVAVGASGAANWMSATSSPAFYSTALGYNALNTAPVSGAAQYNTAIGALALSSDTVGAANTAVGMQALTANTSGNFNAAFGGGALRLNTTGSANTALGYQSLYDLNITAADGSGGNTALGYNTGRGITTGTNNTIIGANVTGLSATLSNNIIIADGAGNQRINVDATGNVGVGTSSPYTAFAVAGSTGVLANVFTATSTTATSSFMGGFSVGQCVTGDTKLRRRRRRKDGSYDYDEPNIIDLQEGDEIQSLDEKTGSLVWSKVKQLAFMGAKQTYRLTTASGKIIRTTANHPYLARTATKTKSSRAYAFIDLANVFRGAESEGWKVDYKKLRRYLATRYGVIRAFVFGGTSNRPDRVELHEQLARFGYDVRLVPTRHFKDGTSKADVDSRMTFEMMRMEKEYDRAVVFTSDGDFYWVLEYLRAVKEHIWLFGVAARTARDLKRMFQSDFSNISDLREVLAVKEETQEAETTRISASPTTYPFDVYGVDVKPLYSRADRLSNMPVDTAVCAGEGSWLKVAELKEGMEVAIAAEDGRAVWDRITSLESVAIEDVYDIEIEGTHNFIGNDIVAHNTAFVVNRDAPANSFYITNSGNIGIGTSSPTTRLSVQGNQYTSGTAFFGGAITATSSLTVSGQTTLATSLSGLLQGASGVVSSISGTAGQFPYYNGTNTLLATSSIFLSQAGNFGIGTVDPLVKVDIEQPRDGGVPGNNSVSVLRLGTDSGTGVNSDTIFLDFYQRTATPNTQIASRVGSKVIDASAFTAGLLIHTTTGGGSNQRMLISTDTTIYGSGTTCTIGNGTGATNCTSDSRLKTNITSISGSEALSKLSLINGVTFNWVDLSKNQSQQVGVIAQDVLQAFPQVVKTATTTFNGVEGSYYTVDYAALVSPLISAVNELNTRTSFISNAATSTVLTVDVAGNVGIGTTTPNHALSVAGDIGATGFVNTSTREAKINISYVSAGASEEMLNQLVDLRVATYRYKIEDQNDPLRLGFIAEEAQQIAPEVLSADGKGVDLYKLATFTLSGVQALAAKVDAHNTRITSLETRVTALESGSISSSSSTLEISSTSIASALNSFGVLIEKGIAQFNTLVFRTLVASKDADGTSSAGSVVMLSGNIVAQVSNSLVASSTKVFVTFNSQIAGSWWVSDKAPGSFRVVLSAPQAGDVSFDYFLVQTEGQIATSSPMVAPGVLQSNGPDTVPPVITLLGDNPVRISIGGVYTDSGVVIADEADGTTPLVTFINGVQNEINATTINTSSQTTYIITYSATDRAGNFSTAIRSVIIGDDGVAPVAEVASSTPVSTDTTPPVVTLVGDAAMQLTLGATFTDPGATATDDVDGILTSSVVTTGSVDTATIGLYTLTYTATDTAGNSSSVSRVITISAPSTTP